MLFSGFLSSIRQQCLLNSGQFLSQLAWSALSQVMHQRFSLSWQAFVWCFPPQVLQVSSLAVLHSEPTPTFSHTAPSAYTPSYETPNTWDCITVISNFPNTVCYHLGKWLNCLVVGVTPPGSAVLTTHVSYTNHASVRGLVSGHWLSQSILLGYLSLMSG
jgi:hypothetical protein